MKTRKLENYGSSVGVEVYDVDWTNQEEVLALGKLCASECIVFLDEDIGIHKLSSVMNSWGDPAGALIHEFLRTGKLQGRHWREIYLALGYTVSDIPKDLHNNVATVTYKRDEKGRAKGAFSNGELAWHSDQCSFDDAQRVIGLQSVSDTANSQTTFLCTHDAFDKMSAEMQSTVRELVVNHRWRDGVMAPGLNSMQTLIIHYNMVPVDGMQTRLYRETASGLPGIKLPTHSFDGFEGMTQDESKKLMEELHRLILRPEYVYTRDWQDGQVVFMDQEITLHARPTNIKDGDLRQMTRVISYVNNIFSNSQRANTVSFKNQVITHEQLCDLVDQDRHDIFNKEQQGSYVPANNAVWAEEK